MSHPGDSRQRKCLGVDAELPWKRMLGGRGKLKRVSMGWPMLDWVGQGGWSCQKHQQLVGAGGCWQGNWKRLEHCSDEWVSRELKVPVEAKLPCKQRLVGKRAAWLKGTRLKGSKQQDEDKMGPRFGIKEDQKWGQKCAKGLISQTIAMVGDDSTQCHPNWAQEASTSS